MLQGGRGDGGSGALPGQRCRWTVTGCHAPPNNLVVDLTYWSCKLNDWKASSIPFPLWSYVELECDIPQWGSLDRSCEVMLRKSTRHIDPCPGCRATYQTVFRPGATPTTRTRTESEVHTHEVVDRGAGARGDHGAVADRGGEGKGGKHRRLVDFQVDCIIDFYFLSQAGRNGHILSPRLASPSTLGKTIPLRSSQ